MGLDGKRNRKSMYAKTRKEVHEKLNMALDAHRKELSFQSDRLTVREFLSDWLRESVKPKVRPRTYQSYSPRCPMYFLDRRKLCDSIFKTITPLKTVARI